MSRAEDIFQKLVYFGEDAIDEFILTLQTEELFLDFYLQLIFLQSQKDFFHLLRPHFLQTKNHLC